ncbi:hypothetical protein [Reyranella soli]|uniref:hypothetical protein n=1 Tax=Reyranella soli TaxID=1230389 RepID=UPI0011BDCB11|nr:hypothetical protein [Reyranella soli]
MKVLKEVRPTLGMLSFNEAALVSTVIENALHPVAIEANNSINRAEPVPIAFAGKDAVPLHHIVIPPTIRTSK